MFGTLGVNIIGINTHDREHFYKYMSAVGAISTLTTLRTRWSSPLLFNDPFDTPLGTTFGFPLKAVPAAMMAKMLALVDSGTPIREIPAPLVDAITFTRLNRSSSAARDDSRLTQIAEQAGAAAQTFREFLDVAWQLRLRVTRLFCVSAIHNDLLLWAHYADAHKGVALRLRRIVERATALCRALPIQYSERIPAVADSVEDWIADHCGERRIGYEKTFDLLTLTKSTHWRYEQEWRCVKQIDLQRLDGVWDWDASNLVEENPLLPEEVDAIYLGCRIAPEHRDEILRIAKSGLPDTSVFQARPSRYAFRLRFDRIP